MSEPILIPMEDDLVHTDERPFCGDPTCPCHEDAWHVGDRVWIRIPFVDGFLHQGTVYCVCRGHRWPYLVMPDGEEDGVAYASDELAPASLPMEQVEATEIPDEDWELLKGVFGVSQQEEDILNS
jgi:hypothetical protein